MPFTPQEFEDSLFTFDQGVNSGVAPLLLDKRQLFTGFNTTVRGTFARPRPKFRKYTLTDPTGLIASALAIGPFQGGGFFNPDNAAEAVMAGIAGRMFQLTPDPTTTTALVTDRTVPGDPNPSTQPQVWLWQGEKWLNWTDGLSRTIFIDETTSVRSNYGTKTDFNTTTATSFTIPPIGSSVTVPVGGIVMTSAANIAVGDVLTIQDHGQFVVNDITGAPSIEVTNVSAVPVGQVVDNGAIVTWSHFGNELPPGRQGAYVMGRNAMALVDGKQFIMSDLVGGSSGTQAENYRDAVKHITENNYLLGGGFFSVPGSLGEITFMRPMATPDTSLGQGPLQVGTHGGIFSCQAPVDRLTWSDLQTPILTQSLIANGGLAQNSTISVNSDLIMRSGDGIRSFMQARRDYDTWGNTPISREVDPQLSKDSPDLLPYGSAIYFDNRLLMTTRPVLHSSGNIYHEGIIPLNFDPISSLRGKAPSVYDSTAWIGLNVLQLVTGEFDGVERAFALTLNLTGVTPELELYEILKSADAEIYDNGTERVVWGFETAMLFNQSSVKKREMLRLFDGEIYVDELRGIVDFQVYYKPDQYPCWVPWFSWQECQDLSAAHGTPGYRPEMGLGQPSVDPCNDNTGRPLREGFGYQIKVVVTGQCRFLGMRVKSVTIPLPTFADQGCKKLCFPTYQPG